MQDEQHVNAAFRLHTLLSAAYSQAPQLQHLQVWANVFKVSNTSGRQQKQAVATGITLLFRQLDHLVEQLRALNQPESSYLTLVRAMEDSISYEWLAQPWEHFRTRLERALYPLQIFSNMLPDEEKLVDSKEFEIISKELDALEQSLAGDEISPEVRNFVRRQIDVIRNAMWEYQFRGAQVFQDAMLSTLRDYMNSDVVAEHKNDPPVQKLGHIWSKMLKVMDGTIKIQGALTAVHKIYQLAASVGLPHHLK